MTDLRQAAQAVVDRWDTLSWSWSEKTPTAILMAALRTALEQPEQDSHWLTKELMADYLDVIAEAVENNNSEILRHKSHWLRAEGDV